MPRIFPDLAALVIFQLYTVVDCRHTNRDLTTSTTELGRELQEQDSLTVGFRVFASSFYSISTRTVALVGISDVY